jgi:hypothetical protein
MIILGIQANFIHFFCVICIHDVETLGTTKFSLVNFLDVRQTGYCLKQVCHFLFLVSNPFISEPSFREKLEKTGRELFLFWTTSVFIVLRIIGLLYVNHFFLFFMIKIRLFQSKAPKHSIDLAPGYIVMAQEDR